MAVTHSTAVRNAIANLVVDSVDQGSGAGTLVLTTSGDVEVATLTFSDPAFGDASAGVATATAVSPDASATGGTVAKGFVKDSDATTIFQLTVGTGGSGDLNLSSLVIGAGDQVSLSNFAYTAPA